MTDATLFVGGRVYTGRQYAEALLVEDGRVAAVGAEASVRAAAATGTERVDLAGGLLAPGLVDAHLHLGDLARSERMFEASPSASLADLGRRLHAWEEHHPETAIVGQGLDPGRLAERRWPTMEELDAIVSDRPLVLYHPSGHAAAVNTLAWERTPGRTEPRDVPGIPRGVLVEEELGGLGTWVEEAVPLTPAAVEETAQRLSALGLTAVGTMSTSAGELAVLRALDGASRLPFRVHAYPTLAAGPVRDRFPPAGRVGRCTVVGVKAFLDGAFGTRTASLTEPYADDPSTVGVDREEDETLVALLEDAREAGLAPALHAIGDRAVARAVRVLSRVRPGNPPARVEHAGLVPPALFRPLRDLGAYVVVQPGFVLSDVWLRDRLGATRSRWAYPLRSLVEVGIPLAASSDAPYDLPDPWHGMRAAVRRRDDLGRSANPTPDEALTDAEAFALFTTGAASSMGDRERGRLDRGAPADLIVLAAPRIADVIRQGSSVVRATWVAGARVRPAPPREERV